MARGKLFEAWTFKLSLPAPFDDPKYSGMHDFGLSQYNTAGRLRKATLHAPSLRALFAYAKLVLATEQGSMTDGMGAIGHQENTFRISEYCSANKTDCVVFNTTTGKFIASQFEDGSDVPKPIPLGRQWLRHCAVFCLMPILEEDTEFQCSFATFKDHMANGWSDMDGAFECALRLCDNIYRRIESAAQVGQAGVKLAVPTTGNIASISPLALDKGSYAPTGATYGEFKILKVGVSNVVSTPVVSHRDFVGKYALSQRQLTAREDAMVPKLPDWYVIPKEVVRVCEHAKLTSQSSQPMRNFLFRGPAGTGKTMGAQAVAAGMHLPYTLMTCSATQKSPTWSVSSSRIPALLWSRQRMMVRFLRLPTSSCIRLPCMRNSPVSTMTPRRRMTCSQNWWKSRWVGWHKGGKHGQRIRYVDTPLLEAIRYGYVAELQERATRS